MKKLFNFRYVFASLFLLSGQLAIGANVGVYKDERPEFQSFIGRQLESLPRSARPFSSSGVEFNGETYAIIQREIGINEVIIFAGKIEESFKVIDIIKIEKGKAYSISNCHSDEHSERSHLSSFLIAELTSYDKDKRVLATEKAWIADPRSKSIEDYNNEVFCVNESY